MAFALAFVLAQEGSLPSDSIGWEQLLAAQRAGVGSGRALRMFRVPPGSSGSLDDRVRSGQATASGADPFHAIPTESGPGDPTGSSSPAAPMGVLVCDALVPYLEPRSLWLGVYQLSGPERPEAAGSPDRRLLVGEIRCLDQFPLSEADNETCWFYPTDNGDYFCWENRRRLELAPGYLPEDGLQEEPIDFRRSHIHRLWSLMADDQALTCVGLTYRRRRIEWPVVCSDPEPCATWTSFRVDTMAEDSYQEIASITVFD